VDTTRSADTGGAGLGLAIVKTICDAHGAAVRVASALGRGSSFYVTFPR
jgi:signal transduction histidine kinase